ncbi:hypothetical protein TeGR_g5264 [Tetraparma gracilis]|uniref:Uncharacterized protein n=1 Tax=Tetraparma gracilis TaxID=2962635 RepID=A0ABQ6MK76_9STRA|nr:hypothetical protein TeGR_g5264 [Tetraparma gracilis]
MLAPRLVASGLMSLISPPAYLYLARYLDQLGTGKADLLACAVLVIQGIGFAKVIRGRNKGKRKGANLAMFAIPVFAVCLYLTLVAVSSSTSEVASSMNASTSGPAPLPLPTNTPAVPSDSTCRWYEGTDMWPISLPSSSTYPDSSILADSTLRSASCKEAFEEADMNTLLGAINALDVVATSSGVTDDQWDKEECKSKLMDVARRAMTPYCSSSCAPLGFCDADCRSVKESCGMMASYHVLEIIIEGGLEYEEIMIPVLGDLAPCVSEIFAYVTGEGDESKICNSASSRDSTFSHMSFGSTPDSDCLLLEDDPNSFLRGSTTGECSLARWDEYDEEFASVMTYNDALTANATAAHVEVDEEEVGPEHPWWREPASALIPALMFVVLWVGDRLSVKKDASSGSQNSVAPVIDSGSQTVPESASTSKLIEGLTFMGFAGATGVFVGIALLALGVLSLVIGLRAENSDDISTLQVLLLYAVALLAFMYWFTFIMNWRDVVNDLADIHEGRVDPLAALNKIPAAKRMMKFYHDNFAIHTAGKFSILVVIGAEVFEFMVQSYNANNLAKFLDWSALSLYATIISVNFTIVGLCLLVPERFVPSSTLITIDVIVDAAYIMFNITFVEEPESYWAIIVPLWFAVDMINDSFTRHAKEAIVYTLAKQAIRDKFEESVANGTLKHDLCFHFLSLLNSGEEFDRKEIASPSGYADFKPRLYTQDSGDAAICTMLLEFDLPGITPGQAFTFALRYTSEELGAGTDRILQVFSKNHQTASVAGSVSSDDCEACEEGKTSDAGSDTCVSGSATSACFTINLMNKWGDPWSGNVLIITSTSNDEVVFELTMSCTSYSDCAAAGFGPQIPESFEDMCFDNCGSCYSGQVGGGNHFDLAETSWNIQDASGEIVAESTSGHPASFCLNDACMVCEAGGRGGGC